MELFKLQLNKFQVKAVSEFFRDLAKLIIASAVIKFFLPGLGGGVPLITFIIGSGLAIVFLVTGVAILKPSKL